MNTYWFTIADGAVYQAHAERLRLSLKAHGVSLAILTPRLSNSREAKHRKISGILETASNCDRIIYLDADTIVLDPRGIDLVNGAWRIPWRIPEEGRLPKTLDPQRSIELLESFYQRYDLSAFAKGGSLEGVEWNSGVIVGDRDVMVELALEWELWWGRILDLFDGHFRRDQLSFRIAYHYICQAVHPEGLPIEYNWIASYFGVNPNAQILHRTMVRNVAWLEDEWERIVAQKLAGDEVNTVNQYFDYSGIATDRPYLQRRTEVDGAIEASLLRQTLALSRPEKVLLCGIREDDRRFLPMVSDRCGNNTCVPSLDDLPIDLDLSTFDLVLICGVDYIIREEQAKQFSLDTVFYFTGIHDMALYKYLYRYEYVKMLDYGFGLFSHSPRIVAWEYQR